MQPSQPEKSALKSKKFIFGMICNLGWLSLIAYGIHARIDGGVLSAMVYAAGIVQSLYLGGQSAVDALVRKAHVTFQKTNKKILVSDQ